MLRTPRASAELVNRMFVAGRRHRYLTARRTPRCAAALYAATRPSATAAQIKSALLASAVATQSLSGKTVTGGRLNVSGF
jgi:hypothetical protein